ncbi:uncharacterized protein BCR38DRAFT_452611 [Pseudomassariella vexata]|uniref:RNA-binding protein n=1 Tax=Pseudomassariella vexata TaxID=1141098 RepID=A0A1Y2D7M5_9PEZI|nr:uncharacterized protein BCR38DRAFT_452611 [Pseudomassariella vexata]ORY55278.1 hypothetical protein BCR38DRAFT_452611 [Pseudomassariella vexata]
MKMDSVDAYEYDPHAYGDDRAHDDHRTRRRDRSLDQGRGRGYRDPDMPRDRRHRSPRDHSSENSADDGSYRENGGYRYGPGRPYHTIKMDEIPGNMSTQDVDTCLRELGAAGLVEVRVKSDDRTGGRRCYAFAEFKSDQAAIDFLERHYPTLKIYAADGSVAHVPLAYSRERRPLAMTTDDWQCTMCHFENFSRRATCKQCKAPRSSENAADMHLDGKSDECPQQAPSQFLVIRNLPSSVNEHVLATGIKKLYVTKDEESKQPSGTPAKLKSTAPIGNTSGLGAKPGSLIRVFIIRDKHSDASCRYGFAEFSQMEDARAIMAKFNASPQFTIASKTVSIAYIHSGVFIPYFKTVPDGESKFTFSATHNPSLRLSYWNPSVYASEFVIFNEALYEEKPTEPPTAETTASAKESKKRKAEKDLVAPSGKKVIAMAPQLQRWANKHAELHGASAKNPRKAGELGEKGTLVTGANKLGPAATATASAPATQSVSYADLDRMCCLLCRRKFISEPSLRRHESLSDLHKTNLDDASLIKKAIKALKEVGKEPTTNYRDRAKERRQAHNQPNRPKPHLSRNNPAAAKENDPSFQGAAPSKPAISKGAGLLAKMGWSAGSGLGAEGEGRTNIIESTAYAPGVGLGAEGGKIGDAAEQAARATRNDYADFVAKAKDKARERYERME